MISYYSFDPTSIVMLGGEEGNSFPSSSSVLMTRKDDVPSFPEINRTLGRRGEEKAKTG